MDSLLKAINISKSFGTLSVVKGVNLQINPGEVMGVTGQSGSGKSTLAMLLAGFHEPDSGEIYFDGHLLHWPYPLQSLGIEVIHQTPNLAENLDITSNIFLGKEIGWPSWSKWLRLPNRHRMEQEAMRILSHLNMHFKTLHESVANLSSEQRQMIAIARVMASKPRLVIIDDPTRLLGYLNQQTLLTLIQTWQEEGVAVFFSSNNLDHLLAVTDHILVLRKGQPVADFQTDEADREAILSAMVGATDRQQLTPIIWALDSYYRAREQAESIQRSRALLEKDMVAQETLRTELIDQLTEQINVLDSANLALQDAQRRLLTELEQERKHLAREIHDQVIQDLLSTNYQLEEIETNEEISFALKSDLTEVRQNIRALVEELRDICGSLRPPTIDSLGLGAAIQSYTNEWTRRTGIPIQLELDENLRRLPEAIELSVFRIVQEGLSNVQKHAHASHVCISLQHSTPRALMLSIADNGQGLPDFFDLSTLSAKGHYGLLGVSERVALLGGRLKLQNQEQGGLIIQVEIPHPRSPTDRP
ncbi:MAG: ATP-binding cassette domain-containing protein [Anaerolineales bacterium]|nr:ATP-binding cassette domain-containing protein [Anaerolineales bacterium]